MSRDVTSFPISQSIRFKLLSNGFITADDINGFKPNELAAETGITIQEALDVIDIILCVKSNLSAEDLLSRSALDVLSDENSKPPVTTSCIGVDAILNGGVPTKKITEICGCPGSGKTQLCMQLCVNVQIPKTVGGVEGEALFIDTEGSFIVQRLFQIANGSVQELKTKHQDSNMKDFTVENILKGIYYYPCKSYIELIARINLLHEFIQQHKKISLIVVDSIAFHFRYGFEENYSLRSRLLNGIVQTLVNIANEYKICVVLTNQMTTKFNEDGSSQLIPALGESWGHACPIRLLLAWADDKRQAHLLKSPFMPEAEAQYTITRNGFRDINC